MSRTRFSSQILAVIINLGQLTIIHSLLVWSALLEDGATGKTARPISWHAAGLRRFSFGGGARTSATFIGEDKAAIDALRRHLAEVRLL